jgi:hypothetical protein
VRSRLRIGSALATLLACQCVILAQSPKKTEGPNICRVYTNSYAYDGTPGRIRAVYAGSFEGSYLVDSKCDKILWFTTPEGNTSVAASLIHSPYPKVAERDFLLVKDKEYEKFTRLAYATVENLQPKYKVTATFTRRIYRCRVITLIDQ